jgi:hypothetical protein
MASSKRNEIRAAIQQRVKRFSAFELLGLDADLPPTPPVEQEQPSPSTEISVETLSLPDTKKGSDISDRLTYPQTVLSDVTSDGLTYRQTPRSDVPSDPTVSDGLIQGGSDSTPPQFDRKKEESLPSSESTHLATSVPLAPLQWRVWQVLLNSEGKVISYQGIASQVKGSIPGIRQAIRIIEREGGILSRPTVREKTQDGAVLQGFRVVLNQAVIFHPISAQEAHKLQQRKLLSYDVSQGLIQPPSDISDGLRMYVCNRIHTYMPEFLRLCPPDWQIREQTLVKIAETFPEMSALEFRRSLRYLVEQSKTAKQAIQNPNAWLKAAFERNGGPLITERMIEAQIDQRSPILNAERTVPTVEIDPDLEILRRYVSASTEDKAAIDLLADERVGRLLETVAADKHDGIREQARIECAREFFARQGQK